MSIGPMSVILGLFEVQMLVLAVAVIGRRTGSAHWHLGALLIVLGGMLTPFTIGYELTTTGDVNDTALVIPSKRRLTGKVAVLIGPKNASATFGFAALVKQHRLATLVGEQTGGNLRGINGGAFFFVQLPGSGIEIDLPLIAYWPDTPQPNAGVMPDVVVPIRPTDRAAQVDPQMDRARVNVSA